MDMSVMLKESPIKSPRDFSPLPAVGSLVEGKVVAKDRASLFVDLGPQGTGIIYGREFYEAKDAIKNLNIGDTVFAKVVELENEDGYKELSLRDATKDMNWQKLRAIKDKGELIKVKITGVNKGGLLTIVSGIQAFLPVSQLSPENYPRVEDADKQKILKELQKFIGKELDVKILDLLAEENKLILSEKAKAEEALREVLKNYKVGDSIDGKITGIADFGVFIKFPMLTEELKNETPVAEQSSLQGGETEEQSIENPTSNIPTPTPSFGVGASLTPNTQIEGLIHISELDWQLVHNPNEIVKVGDIVKAQIININNSQVFLSLKNLKENPWEKIEEKFKKGDKIKGKVTSFSPFGAFVEVGPKIRGLCHISEFASQKEMEELLKIGQEYEFEVLLIEPKEHRMSLKLVK